MLLALRLQVARSGCLEAEVRSRLVRPQPRWWCRKPAKRDVELALLSLCTQPSSCTQHPAPARKSLLLVTMPKHESHLLHTASRARSRW